MSATHLHIFNPLRCLMCLKNPNYFHDNRHYNDMYFQKGSEFINPRFIIYVSYF